MSYETWTDEKLMARMEAIEEFENDVLRHDDGYGFQSALDEGRSEHISIYKELTRRGYRWNNKTGEWEK